MKENNEKFWNFLSTLIFVVLIFFLGKALQLKGVEIKEIPLFDILMLILATYRVTRMVVYDKVFKFFRDFFRNNSHYGIMNSIKTITTCPWCAGVWVSLGVVGIYYLLPYGELFVIVIAISGVATFIQLLVNIVGLIAKEKEIKNKLM